MEVKTMKTTLRIAASVALVAIFIGILDHFLHWMNRPSDFWLWTGLLGLVSLLILAPAVLAIVWNAGRRGERG
jgi:uncharacterized membrane protein HdeD (DUF308 family)